MPITIIENPNCDLQKSWHIWKNVIVVGFAFMLHFTAFWGTSNLQSSLNANDALGTFTLAAIYGSLIISNLFLPAIVIRWFGCKWTMALSFITYLPFILSQFYPEFYTMIPAGLAVGFGGGPLWCAKCTYLSIISEKYSEITGISNTAALTKFFGVFFMFYQFSQVWGNLISSAVLSSGADSTPEPSPEHLDQILSSCGANFCASPQQQTNNTNLVVPEPSKTNLVFGIYLGCMVLASLMIMVGIDSISKKSDEKVEEKPSGVKMLAVTVKHLTNPYQLLILPITMFIGAEQAFIAADFNMAFVSCAWGISNIGFVMICFGVCNGISAILIGNLSKIVRRSVIVGGALMLHVLLIIILLLWQPSSASKLVFFLVAGLWGICDSIWLVQINSLSGLLFVGKEEAAYSNFRLWESIGSVITYTYSPYLCTYTKLYLLLGLLLLGITGYTIVEFLEHRVKKKLLMDKTKGKFELVRSNTRNEML